MTDLRVVRHQKLSEARRASVLAAALVVAKEDGYRKMTRERIARIASVAEGSVNHAFGTMAALRDEVMATALRQQILPIIKQGLADNHPALHNVPLELKFAALQSA